MKKYCSLIGNESQIEPWVLTYEDYPPTFPQINSFNKMLTASSWPVLFYDQIPKRMLKQNPGFPILLRKEIDIHLPDWIHLPLLPGSKNPSNRYFIQTPNDRKPEKILFSLSHHCELSWKDLCLLYPANEHRWVWNAEIDLLESPDYPQELKLGMGDIIYLKNFRPDLMVDLSFGLKDTYTPVHLFSLHNDCDLELLNPLPCYSIASSKKLNRSKWFIYA